jgi:anti-sigma regulatory factor (Ser/Thr protein kinase)/GAF domain-containing protein
VVAFVQTHSERRFRSDDVELANELAARLAELVATSQLAEQASLAQSRLSVLARASAVVESELDVARRAEAVAQIAVPAFADHAAVFLLDRERDVLRFAGAAHTDPSVLEALHDVEWPDIDLDNPSAPATAVRTGAPVLRPYQPHDGPARFLGTDHGDLVDRLATRSVLAVPLRSDEGPLGSLFFSFGASNRRYTDDDVTLAEELARVAAPAIHNALRYQQERMTGEALQRSLLPREVPGTTGVWVATRYIPGTAGLQVGGDWYDVVADGDRVVLAIGDVVGHSIEAAVSMGRFRTVLQFSARQRRGPGEILHLINDFMCSAFADEMATLLVVTYDPTTGTASMASAGHLPPVLLGGGGAQLIGVRPGPPLCVDPTAVFEVTSRTLTAGEMLLLYTDGLVERRGETLDDGIGRLVVGCATTGGGPEEVADRVLLDHLPDSGPADDVAILAARVAVAGASLDLRLPPETATLSAVRRDTRAWLDNLHVADDEANDVVLAVNEAVANAIEHAYAEADPQPVQVHGRVEDDLLVVAVGDEGEWRQPSDDPTRGRGLPIMRALMDDVAVDRRDEGACVTLRKRYRPVR